jgi:hypothetical protein
MTATYRCDTCGDSTGVEDAVGWVEIRALGGHLFDRPEPSHLCRLCWARTNDVLHPAAPVAGALPEVSEHAQNRDPLQ